MSKLGLFARNITTFAPSGEIDEEAQRQYFDRFVASKIGIVMGSSGSGEGFALSPLELKRLFEIGVSECKGKVPVNGNPPEQHTAKATCEMLMLAVEAGVDMVTVFPVSGGHGMKPTDLELAAYYDEVLSTIRHPVALAINPIVGYTPKTSLVADLCRRYGQIESVILIGTSDSYFIQLKGQIHRAIDYYAPFNNSLNWFNLGAAGIYATEANLLPKTYRRYMDLYEQNELKELAAVYSDIQRVIHHVSKWSSSSARFLKMFMKEFKLPGGEGGLREPYRMPPADELAKFTDGLLRLGVPEIDEQARAAGLILPPAR